MDSQVEVRKSNSTYFVATAYEDNVFAGYVQPNGRTGRHVDYKTREEAKTARDLYLARLRKPTHRPVNLSGEVRTFEGGITIAVAKESYIKLSDAFDAHSKKLMTAKGEEYSLRGDFLAMENMLAGMTAQTPEFVSLVMAGKHITALAVILAKNDSKDIKLEKLDERVRDCCNLLKILAAFIHAKQNDFTLHLGKDE